MPYFLIFMLAVGAMVFRRARRAGRRPWVWVLLFWVISIGLGNLVAIVGVVLMQMEYYYQQPAEDLKSAGIVTGVIGFLVGICVSLYAAGREKSKSPAITSEHSGRG